MSNKSASKKRSGDQKSPKTNEASKLESVYRQYLTPMPMEQWSQTRNLSQPTILKRVPTRTAYSSVE